MPPEQPTDDLASLLRLPDGTPARLRAVVGTDRQLLQDMYAALSQVSRRGRSSLRRRGSPS